MKRCINIAVCTILLVFLSVPSVATDLGELENAAEEIYDFIPQEFYELSDLKDEDLNSDSVLNFTNIIKTFLKAVAAAFLKYKTEYTYLLVLVFTVYIYEAVFRSFERDLSSITNNVIFLVLGWNLLGIVNAVTESFISVHSSISGFVSAVSAVSVASMAASASANSAALFGTECSVLVAVYNFICSKVVIPFSVVYIILAIYGGSVGDLNIKRISSFIRNTSIGIIGIFLSLFSGIMAVQSVVIMSKDTLLKKMLKQALSAGLPVLGGAVSEGLDTLFSSALAIKNHVGMLGLTISVILSVSPIAELLVCFVVMSVIVFILSFSESEALSSLFSAVRDVISVLICISISLTVMVFLLFYFIIRIY